MSITPSRNYGDEHKGRVVLENPEIVKEIEDALIADFYPYFHTELENSGFRYYPSHLEPRVEPKIAIVDQV